MSRRLRTPGLRLRQIVFLSRRGIYPFKRIIESSRRCTMLQNTVPNTLCELHFRRTHVRREKTRNSNSLLLLLLEFTISQTFGLILRLTRSVYLRRSVVPWADNWMKMTFPGQQLTIERSRRSGITNLSPRSHLKNCESCTSVIHPRGGDITPRRKHITLAWLHCMILRYEEQ